MSTMSDKHGEQGEQDEHDQSQLLQVNIVQKDWVILKKMLMKVCLLGSVFNEVSLYFQLLMDQDERSNDEMV